MGLLSLQKSRISGSYEATVFGQAACTTDPTVTGGFFTVNGNHVSCWGEVLNVDPDGDDANYFFLMSIPFPMAFTNLNQIIGLAATTGVGDVQISIIANLADNSCKVTRNVLLGTSVSARKLTFQFAYLKQ